VVDGLPARSPDLREERKGPRVDAPDAAIKGFLKSAGLASVEEAERRDDKKGPYYVATIQKRGSPTAEVVAEIVPEIVKDVASLQLNQRTPAWVMPRPNNPIPEGIRRVFTNVPGTRAALRARIYWMHEPVGLAGRGSVDDWPRWP